MAIRFLNADVSPQNLSGSSAETTVSATLASTRSEPSHVTVSFTTESPGVSLVASPKVVTIPAATDENHGEARLSQRVTVSGGQRPSLVTIDIKAWHGAVNDPSGPLHDTFVSVSFTA